MVSTEEEIVLWMRLWCWPGVKAVVRMWLEGRAEWVCYEKNMYFKANKKVRKQKMMQTSVYLMKEKRNKVMIFKRILFIKK